MRNRITNVTWERGGLILAIAAVVVLNGSLGRAADGEKKVDHVDTPLDREVNGRTWTIRVAGSRGTEDGSATAYADMSVLLRVKTASGAPLMMPYNYAIKMTVGDVTRYQWHGNKPVDRMERALSARRFGRLDFPGLAPGSSQPYRVEIRTSNGIRLLKEGTLKVAAQPPQHAAMHLNRAADAMARAEASLAKAKPGTRKEYDANVSYAKALLGRATAQVKHAGAKPEAAWRDLQNTQDLMARLAEWPKPSDDRSTPDAWAARVASSWPRNCATIASAASSLFCSQSAGKIESLIPEIEKDGRTTTVAGYHKNIAVIRYSLTGSAAQTVPALERAYELFEKDEREKAARAKRAPIVRPLARQVLPHDFEPVTLTRNDVQAQLCDALEAVAKIRREMNFTDDRKVRDELREEIENGEAEATRLRELLATIPGPSDTSRFAVYSRVRGTISRSFDVSRPDQVAAQKQALANFDDMIFVESDKSVHGDFKAALKLAMPETAWADKQPLVSYGEMIQSFGDNSEQILKAIQILVEHDSSTGALKRLRDVSRANEQIAGLHKATTFLKATNQEHLQQLPAILQKITDLVETGPLSPSNLALTLKEVRALPEAQRQAADVKKAIDALDSMESLRRAPGLGGMAQRLKAGMKYALALEGDDVKKIAGAVSETFEEMKFNRPHTFGPLDKIMLTASALQSAGMMSDMIERGVDPFEAGGRAAAPLLVDIAFTAVPIAGMIDIVSEVMFISLNFLWTGKVEKYNASDAVKDIVSAALDKWAAAAGASGEFYEYLFHGTDARLNLKQFKPEDVRRYLARVECKLAALPTDIYTKDGIAVNEDGKEAARLLRMRSVFRVLLRAQADAGIDRWRELTSLEFRYVLKHPPGWTLADRSEKNPTIHRKRVAPPGFDPIEGEMFVEVEVIPQQSLRAMNRRVTMVEPKLWWKEKLGGAELPDMELIQQPNRADRGGKPVNVIEFTATSPITKSKVWVIIYQAMHAGQSIELRIACPADRVATHREALREVVDKFIFLRVREPRRR